MEPGGIEVDPELLYDQYVDVTAAQSSLIAAIDEALGLPIARDEKGGASFLAEMRA